jgi:hypothetical protein
VPPTATAAPTEAPHAGHEESAETHEETHESEPAHGPVAVVVRLYQMEGHLTSSRELWEAGDPMAGAHAAHPLSELFPAVEGALAEAGVDTQALLDALTALPQLVTEADADPETVAASYDQAREAIEAAAQQVAGEAFGSPAFTAQVIAGLLNGVAAEYGEAVQNGELVNVEEYQDAYGFLQVAKRLNDGIQAETEARDAGEAEEVAHAFQELDELLPQALPPDVVVEGIMVSNEVQEIVAELSRIYEFQVVESSTEETLAFIQEQLDAALAAYQEGDADQAYERAASAYLDGFEYLEAPLLEQNAELVETLEIQFKRLRDEIQAGAPLDDLQALVEEIRAGLEKVREILADVS